jgi:Flp pilus assembly protein TadG
MIRRLCFVPRRGATVLEMALVVPVYFVIVFGLFEGAMGVLRFQQVAALAREGTRWASVHGGQYGQDSGNSAATSQDVYNNAIKPKATGLDLTQLTYSVTWNSSNYPYHTVIDASNNIVKVTNTVTVTVNYTWASMLLFGNITLTSTAALPMAY